MLRSRVAVLEEQLASVKAQKESADTSNRYLLHLLSAGNTNVCLESTPAAVSELRRKVLVSKIIKNQSKADLQNALLLRNLPRNQLCQCCRTRAGTQSDGFTAAIEHLPTRSSDSTGPVTGPLIDFADSEASTSAEDTPGLDESDRYSSASDDSEERLRDAPCASHRTRMWCLDAVKCGEQAAEDFPKESSYLQHFSTWSGPESTAGYDHMDIKVRSPPTRLIKLY